MKKLRRQRWIADLVAFHLASGRNRRRFWEELDRQTRRGLKALGLLLLFLVMTGCVNGRYSRYGRYNGSAGGSNSCPSAHHGGRR